MRESLAWAVLGLGLTLGGCASESPPAGGTDAAAEAAADPGSGGPDAAPDADPDAAAPDAAPDTGPEGTAWPGCDFDYTGSWLVAGPCEPDFDGALEAKATRFERSWRTFNAAATGVNTDVSVALESADDRELVRAFVQEHEGWDFEAFAGKSALDLITSHHKVAGLYGGVGIAADAFRYGVLRDQGYPADQVERARQHLLVGLEGFHRAATLPGVPGVIARGYIRTDLPGGGYETVPLFDARGNPLPEPKNNGTWREDFSGEYPNYIWEDSISRDQMLGWVTAAAAAWEVMQGDPSFDEATREMVRQHATDLGRELMVVRDSGYDLEIPDADGRTTLHGYINEHNIDGTVYLEDLENGFHALMALGFVAAWVYVSGDAELEAWLYDELIEERRLHEITRDSLFLVWMGNQSNYSNYNMAFGSFWLALRYLDHPEALEVLREALDTSLYAIPGEGRQPAELKMSYYDFIYAAGIAGLSHASPLAGTPDEDALARGLETLHDFAEPPYWDEGFINCPAAVCDCDDKSIPDEAKQCTALDGSELTVLGCVGRNCDLITLEPVPKAVWRPSNYHWRSNPFKPNNPGSGGTLLPGVDFRIAYWTGRWVRRSD